jgi:8-oxo-dGTP pyrophosphatase MutT (NUDIX family)
VEFEMKEAVVALIINQGLILGISRRNDKTKFGLIGGKVDSGETCLEALTRETLEECGIFIKSAIPIYERVELGDGPNGVDFYVRCYYATDWLGIPQSSEEGEVAWLTVKEITETKAAFGEYNKSTLEKFKVMFPNVCLKTE